MALHSINPFPLKPGRSMVIALFLAVTLVALGFSDSTQTTEAQSTETVVQEIQVVANDVAYDPAGDRLYVSVPSRFGQTGNSVIQINPNTLTAAAPIHVGSEPERMTISGDGKYLYVAVRGSATIRRINLSTQTAEPPFPVGNSVATNTILPQIDGAFFAHDLRAMPGDSNSLAVIGAPGPSIFTNGTKLPTGTVDIAGTHRIVFGASASTAYGVGSNAGFFYKYAIDANGITTARTTHQLDLINQQDVEIEFGGGFIYTTNGLKIDPEVPKVVGNVSVPFPNFIYGVIPDTQTGRLYVLNASTTCNTCVFTASVHAFDLETLAPLGSIQIPGVRGVSFKRFIRWGANGLAFVTNTGQLYVLRTSLVPSNAPVTLPAPTHPARVDPVTITGSIRQISLPNSDLIYDPQRAVIYATVPGFTGAANGNSVIPINPVTGELGVPKSIGIDPSLLALSGGNKYLWVAILGEQKVRRLNLQSNAVDVEFGTESPSSNSRTASVMPASSE